MGDGPLLGERGGDRCALALISLALDEVDATGYWGGIADSGAPLRRCAARRRCACRRFRGNAGDDRDERSSPVSPVPADRARASSPKQSPAVRRLGDQCDRSNARFPRRQDVSASGPRCSWHPQSRSRVTDHSPPSAGDRAQPLHAYTGHGGRVAALRRPAARDQRRVGSGRAGACRSRDVGLARNLSCNRSGRRRRSGTAVSDARGLARACARPERERGSGGIGVVWLELLEALDC